jgi:hypothetical protein
MPMEQQHRRAGTRVANEEIQGEAPASLFGEPLEHRSIVTQPRGTRPPRIVFV